jgi:hypothetical protein
VENLNNPKDYYLKAYLFTLEWVKRQFKSFTSEDLKDELFEVIGTPNEKRVIGAIFREMNKLGLIKRNGFGIYKAKQGHGKPVSKWISKEYSLTQQKNRSSKEQFNLFD